MSIPTAAVVAGPEPEIAPKNTQASAVEIARPPGIGPTIFSAICTSRFEIPAASISAPARTKQGSAMSGNAVRFAKAFSIIILISMPSIKKHDIVAIPSATMMGLPISKRAKNTQKSTAPIIPGVISSILLLPLVQALFYFLPLLLGQGRQYRYVKCIS